MIETEKQYKITLAQIENFKSSIHLLEEQKKTWLQIEPRNVYADQAAIKKQTLILLDLHIKAQKSMLEELEDLVKVYKKREGD